MTTFSSENQPKKRGKAFKTKLMDAIKRDSLLVGITEASSDEKAEAAFISHWATRAFDPEDKDNATLLKGLGDKAYSSLKSTMPTVNFKFSVKATPTIQANEIIKAAAEGIIPPDVAQIFISSIASMMKIEEVTEIAKRLTEIEKALGIGNA